MHRGCSGSAHERSHCSGEHPVLEARPAAVPPRVLGASAPPTRRRAGRLLGPAGGGCHLPAPAARMPRATLRRRATTCAGWPDREKAVASLKPRGKFLPRRDTRRSQPASQGTSVTCASWRRRCSQRARRPALRRPPPPRPAV
eukprot:scaffold16743_cov129-Isochrysis_galbana.AAC.3